MKKEVGAQKEKKQALEQSRPSSENFLDQEERKSGTHPQIVEKSKFAEGTKEHEFEQNLQMLYSKFDDFEAENQKINSETDDELAKLKA